MASAIHSSFPNQFNTAGRIARTSRAIWHVGLGAGRFDALQWTQPGYFRAEGMVRSLRVHRGSRLERICLLTVQWAFELGYRRSLPIWRRSESQRGRRLDIPTSGWHTTYQDSRVALQPYDYVVQTTIPLASPGLYSNVVQGTELPRAPLF